MDVKDTLLMEEIYFEVTNRDQGHKHEHLKVNNLCFLMFQLYHEKTKN
jgi:hypothetical protein